VIIDSITELNVDEKMLSENEALFWNAAKLSFTSEYKG
jgi:hypothetical protein